MFNAFMITLREGIEAFLIVAITLAYLKKTGRAVLARAVFMGVGVALVASYAASLEFARAQNQPLWEGVLACVTAILVVTFTVQVLRTAKFLKGEIEGHLERAAVRPGHLAFLGVLAFTVLMITREGMEAALLLSSTFVQTGSRPFFTGALLGLSSAGALAVALESLRSPYQPRTLPAGDRHLPVAVRSATADLWLSRADRIRNAADRQRILAHED